MNNLDEWFLEESGKAVAKALADCVERMGPTVNAALPIATLLSSLISLTQGTYGKDDGVLVKLKWLMDRE